MPASRVVWLAFLLVSRVSAQRSSVPYDSFSGPTFYLTSVSYLYPSNYRSIRKVDFKNLTLNLFDEKAKRSHHRLKEGRCQIDYHPGHVFVNLKSIHYLGSGEASRPHAMVLYHMEFVGGSPSQEGIAQVFELFDGHLRVTQQIDWDLHFGGPWGPFDPFDKKTNTFVIHTAHYLPGRAHCCVSAVDVVTLHWKGGRFVRTDMRTELSDYGKREGKELQP